MSASPSTPGPASSASCSLACRSGNYLGGVVADRQASRRTLGIIFIAGSVACLLILVITDLVIGQTLRLSLLPRIVVYTTAIFLLPSLVLGMVSPLVVKLSLADLQRTGNTVGTIYAFSTAGSIVGTFLTGFWLISWLGTRTSSGSSPACCLLTGLAVGEFHRSRGLGRLAAGLLAPVLALLTFTSYASDGMPDSIERRATSSRTTTASRSTRPSRTDVRRRR